MNVVLFVKFIDGLKSPMSANSLCFSSHTLYKRQFIVLRYWLLASMQTYHIIRSYLPKTKKCLSVLSSRVGSCPVLWFQTFLRTLLET